MNYLVNICAVVVLVCVISILWDCLHEVTGVTVMMALLGGMALCGLINNWSLE